MICFVKIIIFLFFISLSLKILFSLSDKKILKYIFTPLTTFLVLLIPILTLFYGISSYRLFVLIGLLFSLIGDIFNMNKKKENSQFIYGIIAFLLTHLFYIFAFFQHYSFSYIQLFPALFLLITVIFIYNIFKKNISLKVLKFGVLIYIFIVSTMVFVAVGTFKRPVSFEILLIPVGSILFWLSDLALGIDAFYKKLKPGVLIVWGLYAPAQLLIALSTL